MPRPIILIAEDEQQLRHMFAEVLRQEGYGVEEAPNGYEALTILQRPPAQSRILLLDLIMPEVDGWAVVRWLVEHPIQRAHTKIVLMSANERLRTASLLEHDAELAKPFSMDHLLAVVAQMQ